eukprot:5562232-Pyramimonas_sp.AAC.1
MPPAWTCANASTTHPTARNTGMGTWKMPVKELEGPSADRVAAAAKNGDAEIQAGSRGPCGSVPQC